MSEKHHELARQWVRKAEHDLVTARQTLLLPDGPTDTPCFHSQQAVEKALKAVLTFHQAAFPKTHDLMQLLELAAPYLPALRSWRDPLTELADYAVDVRYPTDGADPSRDDARRALEIAEHVLALVRSALVPAPAPGP